MKKNDNLAPFIAGVAVTLILPPLAQAFKALTTGMKIGIDQAKREQEIKMLKETFNK